MYILLTFLVYLRKSCSVSFDWLHNYTNVKNDLLAGFEMNKKPDLCQFEDNFADMFGVRFSK